LPNHRPARSLDPVDADSGKVLHAENATYPWYPASITKIMTTYVTLPRRQGRPDHARQAAGGLAQRGGAVAGQDGHSPPAPTVTVDNALKMLMVKSANDIAVVIAEGVAGSIENFADQMNRNAQRLGMTQSHFVNPKRAARRRADHVGPRHGDPGPDRHQGISGIRPLLAPAGHPHGQDGPAQLQHAHRPLSGADGMKTGSSAPPASTWWRRRRATANA